MIYPLEVMEANGGQNAENVDHRLQQQNKIMESIFIQDDKDKDEFISHAEFSGPKHDEL